MSAFGKRHRRVVLSPWLIGAIDGYNAARERLIGALVAEKPGQIIVRGRTAYATHSVGRRTCLIAAPASIHRNPKPASPPAE